jgi:hypothetical protein
VVIALQENIRDVVSNYGTVGIECRETGEVRRIPKSARKFRAFHMAAERIDRL